MLPKRPRAGLFRGQRLIEVGAHGAVWSALGPAGPVALKIARQDDAPRLVGEREALRRLDHPHVVRLVQGGPGWLATELVEGVPLDRWARGRPAEPILDRALELVDALRHLHERGVVHGDVSPRNVLVDTDGYTKLLDVAGLSPTERGGTPGFVAPEVLRGARRTRASDQYGVGATLYATLAGQLPFPSSEPAAQAHLPTVTSPVPVGAFRIDVPEKVERTIAALLLRDPERRPTLDEVAATLARAWKSPPRRPVIGMHRSRQAVHDALSRAVDGKPVVVLLYGAPGTGRRTLLGEAMRQARIEGLDVQRRYEPETLLDRARAGGRPFAATRLASPATVDEAKALLATGRPGMLVLYGPTPSDALVSAGALQITPDALGLDDARALASWLGVERDEDVERAWRRTQGHPRALWIALEPHATRHTEDRTPFSLPTTAAGVVAAMRESRGVVPLDRLASRTRLPLPVLVEQLQLLEATGRLRAEGDGWMIRLLDADDDLP